MIWVRRPWGWLAGGRWTTRVRQGPGQARVLWGLGGGASVGGCRRLPVVWGYLGLGRAV